VRVEGTAWEHQQQLLHIDVTRCMQEDTVWAVLNLNDKQGSVWGAEHIPAILKRYCTK
jgi:hypothetical protein